MAKLQSASGHRVTSKDVAKLAGVSQATVSRAYNPEYHLNAHLKEKVFAAAKELGYSPNAIARTLNSSKSNIIGIVTTRLDNPFFAQALQLFVAKLQAIGYQSLVFLPEHSEDIDTVIDRVLGYRVELVLVFAATSTTTAVKVLVEKGIPAVLFNRYIPLSQTSAVCCNDYQCGYMVARELVKCNCKNYAFITGNKRASTSVDRQRGYIDGLASAGIHICNIVGGGYSYMDGMEAGKELMEAYPDTDAVFCVSDILATGVMDYLKYHAHKKIPEDICIVGFDDISIARMESYGLSTVHQPMERMVDATIETILEVLKTPDCKPILKILDGEFIRRNTTR